MVFESFRTDRLAENQISTPIEFVVLLEAEQTFVRVIAHFKDDVVHGGTPPTCLIQAGLGEPTAVDEGAGQVNIPGSGEATVATATCQRTADDIDTYLIMINHSTPSGPWQLHIKNNEPEALVFIGFISHEERETRQAWLEFGGPLRLGGVARTTAGVLVRNLGTAALTIHDEPGDRIGPKTSPVSVFKKPSSIAPHHTDKIVAECAALLEREGPRTEIISHTFKTTDPIPAHARITTAIEFPVLPATRCRGDGTPCHAGCREFIPRFSPDECQCETCFHDAGSHDVACDDGRFPE